MKATDTNIHIISFGSPDSTTVGGVCNLVRVLQMDGGFWNAPCLIYFLESKFRGISDKEGALDKL
jgi:hypothetical protein